MKIKQEEDEEEIKIASRHTYCNPSAGEAEAGGLQVQAQARQLTET